MSSRERGATTGPGVGAILEALTGRLGRVERSVRALQGQRGQSLPADWRFGTDDAGRLVARRVSTSETFYVTLSTSPPDDDV